MRRWRRRGPFKSSRLPGIVRRFLALEETPDQIKIENKLDGDRDNRGHGDEQDQPFRVLQKLIFVKSRITSWHAEHSHCVKGNEDRVNAEERKPKEKLAQT